MTNNSTALATINNRQLTPDTWAMIQTIAPVMKDSRLFGAKSVEGAMAIMIKGYELGFSLSASFENLVEIDGKVALIPKGALAMVFNSSHYTGIKIEDETDGNGAPTVCKVWMKRKNGFEYTAKFSMEDAKRAGLIKPNSGWDKYPANMLRWRAIGFCADIVFPDVIGGMKRADELGADLTPDGDVIDGSWSVQGSQPTPAVTPAQPATTVTAPDPMTRLNALLAEHGAEKIMQANSGKIPGTNEELDAIEKVLSVSHE